MKRHLKKKVFQEFVGTFLMKDEIVFRIMYSRYLQKNNEKL